MAYQLWPIAVTQRLNGFILFNFFLTHTTSQLLRYWPMNAMPMPPSSMPMPSMPIPSPPIPPIIPILAHWHIWLSGSCWQAGWFGPGNKHGILSLKVFRQNAAFRGYLVLQILVRTWNKHGILSLKVFRQNIFMYYNLYPHFPSPAICWHAGLFRPWNKHVHLI